MASDPMPGSEQQPVAESPAAEPAHSDAPCPTEGGSYTRDPETGALTRVAVLDTPAPDTTDKE